MPFDLKNAGATYQRANVTLFHDMMHKEIEVYVDCHNPILGYSPKFTFFKIKTKKNKIKAGNVEKADQEK
jgi:hypothetical protein